MTVAITRDEHSAGDLRRAAAETSAANAARRMLALALVLEGASRAEAARQCGMDRQTLRDWVHRYNAEGLGGLSDRPHAGGPARKLTEEQQAQISAWVREGPKLEEHGVMRWRRADLRDEISKQFKVSVHERSVGKLLAPSWLPPHVRAPRHPRADVDAQRAHKKTSSRWSPLPSRRPARQAA